jgi:hypothetical protein
MKIRWITLSTRDCKETIRGRQVRRSIVWDAGIQGEIGAKK